MITNEQFKNECNKRLGIIIKCFNKKELQSILDFIQTASNLTDKELESINPQKETDKE